jgi:hypothetical protein
MAVAAHRRIHLGQQRCRHLHVGDAPHVTRGGESGHVTHDTTTERDQKRLSIVPVAKQRFEDVVCPNPVLVLLSSRQLDAIDARAKRGQRRSKAVRVKRRDLGVRNHHDRCRLRKSLPTRRRIDDASSDQDSIAAVTKVDWDHVRRQGWLCHAFGRTCETAAWPEGRTPASSSCINTMLTKVWIDGRPVSITK